MNRKQTLYEILREEKLSYKIQLIKDYIESMVIVDISNSKRVSDYYNLCDFWVAQRSSEQLFMRPIYSEHDTLARISRELSHNQLGKWLIDKQINLIGRSHILSTIQRNHVMNCLTFTYEGIFYGMEDDGTIHS